MGEPERVVQSLNMVLPLDIEDLGVVPSKRDHVPSLGARKVERHDLSTLALHVEAREAVGSSHFQDALAVEGDVAKVVGHPMAEVPFTSNRTVARNVHRVVEVALLHVLNQSIRGKNGHCLTNQ